MRLTLKALDSALKAMNNLRAALEQPFSPEAISATQAAWKMGYEARKAEEQAEPDSPERRCGGPRCNGTCCQPVEEPVAYSEGRTLHWHEGKGVSDAQLFAAPPQRKPLPASEIVTMYDENPRGDSDMIAFARAIERAHGIGGSNE